MSSQRPDRFEESVLRQRPLGGSDRDRRRDRIRAGAFAAGVHLAVLGGLLWPKGEAPSQPETSLTLVSLDVSKPPGPPNPASAESDASNAVPPPTPMQVRAPVFAIAPVPDNSDLLSESQIAGAASAGEGGGGGSGSCDLARAVQQALRRDPLVRMAVDNANRRGKAVMMWNGDWVRSGAQDGKGLSAVREAITWAVAFAPESCRNEPMRGLVLVSLADSGTRFAIGTGAWRWSDLLGLRRSPPVR